MSHIPSNERPRYAVSPADVPLGRALQASPGFSVKGLLLAIVGSVVGTVLPATAGTGPWGTLAGAALVPVISTTFSTKVAGEKGRVRAAAIVLLSLAALLITYVGISAADKATGKAVIPGADGKSTFPAVGGVSNSGSGNSGSQQGSSDGEAHLSAPKCDQVAVGSTTTCSPAVMSYTGTGRIRITRIEITGADQGDFSAGTECLDQQLGQGATCQVSVTFHPSAAGQRHATLVVHQTLPPPDTGTKALLVGTASDQPVDPDKCIDGYAWREAVAGDHVCVTPATRDQTQQDNSLAASRRSPTGGDYGPDTCLNGYVWREAVDGDHVCVTPETRRQAQQDNALAASRRVG